MDALITAAARALAGGDPLGALKRVALRDDAPALALRGIAMAQLGQLEQATALLKRARRAFGRKDTLARARCLVAEAEVALASRHLEWPIEALDRARSVLERNGDRANAAQAGYLAARRQLLTGHVHDAESTLAGIDPSPLPPAAVAVHELLSAGIALRRLQTCPARSALQRAALAAQAARIPALINEVANASQVLDSPAAYRVSSEARQPLRLADVEALFSSDTLVIDACRFRIRYQHQAVTVAGRPVLFSLARALGEAWPASVPRHILIHKAFQLQYVDESARGRLRVEMGRLRSALSALAHVRSSGDGFVLTPRHGQEVVVLVPPVDDKYAAILALLADGEAWSSSSLALALGISQRTVQRGLDALVQADRVQGFGRGRARRWITPSVPGFTTTLLLPAPLSAH
ncbi:helix-turn-helix domain-containing protein [Marinobacter sp.]|uniref:helix-turn-helix domain-containing protein n=1 Tax=Marinobacter sp. TaxID=50741 RepID=UPI00356926D4